jgi:hypothetical protein
MRLIDFLLTDPTGMLVTALLTIAFVVACSLL